MPIIRFQQQPECVERLIRQEVESSFLQDVVFLCEDGMVGFTRCLLSASPLLLELIPGSSCCEKLLRAGEAKVHLSLDGVKVMDLQKVLGFLTGVKQQITSESLEVAAMMVGPPFMRVIIVFISRREKWPYASFCLAAFGPSQMPGDMRSKRICNT